MYSAKNYGFYVKFVSGRGLFLLRNGVTEEGVR